MRSCLTKIIRIYMYAYNANHVCVSRPSRSRETMNRKPGKTMDDIALHSERGQMIIELLLVHLIIDIQILHWSLVLSLGQAFGKSPTLGIARKLTIFIPLKQLIHEQVEYLWISLIQDQSSSFRHLNKTHFNRPLNEAAKIYIQSLVKRPLCFVWWV